MTRISNLQLDVRDIDLASQSSTFEAVDILFVLMGAFGVFLITPAIGLLYGGTLKRKNMVQLLFQTYMITNSVIVLWYLVGYSLGNSPSSTSKLIGDFKHAALYNDQAKPLIEGGTIPSAINFCFNVFFPVATVQIFVGSIGERGRFFPSIVVGLVWVIVCYCPFAFWVWGANGWLYNLGALDFAGGGPVHIASGIASLCYSWYLGPRGQPGQKRGKILHYRGHSSVSTFIGTTLIWAAWFMFNSGTLLSINVRTCYIMLNTIIASAFASTTYVALDKFLTGKYSLQAACEGVIVGLVNITPSCGFYWPWAAAVTSIINALICRSIAGFNDWTGIDDYSFSFVVHGVGGIVAGTLVGIFGNKTVASFDGVTVIDGGWVDGNFKQLGYQIAAWASIAAWTTIFTLIILFVVDHIPGLKLRASPEGEDMGMDALEMAETVDEFGNNYEELFAAYVAKRRGVVDFEESGLNCGRQGSLSEDTESVIGVNVVNMEKV